MDKTDRRILSILQNKPESSTQEIADAVGLSNTPCWRRIKNMEISGIIMGKALLLNGKALGLAVNVLAELRLKQHDEATLLALEEAVRNQPEIVECFSVSGENDYFMRIVTASIESYEIFLKKVLLHLPGVTAVNSRFALGCIKLTNALPI